MPDFILETDWRQQGFWPLAGVDEVGRGPLAGPVVAAAVILNPDQLPPGLDDSKRLTARTRDRLYDCVLDTALAVSLGMVPAPEIDMLNIRQATHKAMRMALQGLSVPARFALVDGNDAPSGLPCSIQTVIKGDGRSLSIAAASIVAKVTRDRLMTKLARHHPGFGFETHMGYGTPQHLQQLRAQGPTLLHRRSFAPVARALTQA